jgi:hypothetical protein
VAKKMPLQQHMLVAAKNPWEETKQKQGALEEISIFI